MTCKDGKATWPACGSDTFTGKRGTACMCGTGDTANTCQYGQKCLTSGANKDMCDCQKSDTVICVERVPPSDKCPLDCAGHTTVGASAFQPNECLQAGDRLYAKYVIEDGGFGAKYFTDKDCKTADSSRTMTTESAGCNGDSYVEIPKSASSGTALKTMPIVLMVSILASMMFL